MADGNHTSMGMDPFTRFWTEFMTRAGGGSMMPPLAMTPEGMEQARKTFFEVLAKHAEEFMRSEQFLTAMKHSLDNALAFKQQMNQFLTRGLQTAQMPSRADSDHMVLLIRGVEDRILDKLDELGERVEALESTKGKGVAGVRRGKAGKTTGPRQKR